MTIFIDAPAPSSQLDSPMDVEDANVDIDDWMHDAEWVSECVQHLLPAPADATRVATTTLQRELRAMLQEQDTAIAAARRGEKGRLRDLGWYMPPGFIGDNLFQWIVELHSFESRLPIAQDLAARCVPAV